MPSEYKQCECGNGFSTAKGEEICPQCRKGVGPRTSAQRRHHAERNAPGGHTNKQWFARIAFQKELCFWCFKTLIDSHGNFNGTKDHLIPITRGGTHYIENIVAACYPCNRDKGARTATEYRDTLVKRAAKNSTVSALTASTNDTAFSPRMNLSTLPLEAREAVFDISNAKRMPSDPTAGKIAARRELLRQQVLEIQRLQLVAAGQLTLPIFGDGSARKLAETETAALVVSEGLTLVERKA